MEKSGPLAKALLDPGSSAKAWRQPNDAFTVTSMRSPTANCRSAARPMVVNAALTTLAALARAAKPPVSWKPSVAWLTYLWTMLSALRGVFFFGYQGNADPEGSAMRGRAELALSAVVTAAVTAMTTAEPILRDNKPGDVERQAWRHSISRGSACSIKAAISFTLVPARSAHQMTKMVQGFLMSMGSGSFWLTIEPFSIRSGRMEGRGLSTV